MTRKVIQMSLNQNSSILGGFVQAFGPQLIIFNVVVLVSSILNEKIETLFFLRKIVASLVYIFTMGKALVRIIFGHKIIICRAIFKIFQALLTTFGMQKGDNITSCWKCFRTS